MKTAGYQFFKLFLNGYFRSVCSWGFPGAVFLIGFGYYFGLGGTESQVCSDLSDLLAETMYNGDLAVLTVLGSTMPGAAMFFHDYHTGEFKFIFMRSGICLYGGATMLSCALAGGLANVAGRAVMFLLGWLQGYGGFSAYGTGWEDAFFWYDSYRSGETIWLSVSGALFCCFCMGMILAAAGMCISAFLLSPYAAYIFPYALFVVDKLAGAWIPDYIRVVPMWMGVSLSESMAGNWNRTWMLTFFYVFLFFVLFLWKMVHRQRLG